MTAKLTRREVIVRCLWAAPGLVYVLPSAAFAADAATRLAELEKTNGGRLLSPSSMLRAAGGSNAAPTPDLGSCSY
jgi:hypothetical protein